MSAFALDWAVRSQHGARELWLEQVKSEERALLARELHETVAHHVSAIAVQAQAGRALAATSPSSPLEALEVIELEASRTLAEMRAMVRVLRNEGPVDYARSPVLATSSAFPGPRLPGLGWRSRFRVTLPPSRRRSTPRSSGSLRRRSPMPGGMPGTPP